MVLVLVAKALLAVLIFGAIAFSDRLIDYLAGPMPGIDAELPADDDG
jgi:hypothetical protein